MCTTQTVERHGRQASVGKGWRFDVWKLDGGDGQSAAEGVNSVEEEF